MDDKGEGPPGVGEERPLGSVMSVDTRLAAGVEFVKIAYVEDVIGLCDVRVRTVIAVSAEVSRYHATHVWAAKSICYLKIRLTIHLACF
jgi:hypothetical protein